MSAGDQLGLHVEVERAGGGATRWHGADRDPGNRPQDLTFSTARMDGFKTLECGLARPFNRDHPDLRLFNTVRVVSDAGEVAWEGRATAFPRTSGQAHRISVQAAGLMASARDRPFQMIFVDRDASAWSGPSLGRRVQLALADVSSSELEYQSDGSGWMVTFPNAPLGSPSTVAELWYLAPDGCKVGSFAYQETNQGTYPDWSVAWYSADDREENGSALIASTTGLPSNYLTLPTAKRALFLQTNSNGFEITPEVGQHRLVKNLAVYGDHGLRIHAIDGQPGGVTASDVIRWVIRTYCPELNAGGVQDTTYPIGHLAFREPTDPYDAMLTVNGYHRWSLECWEGGTVHYGPTDLTGWEWELREADFGVSLEDQGLSALGVANGMIVRYTDARDGEERMLTPVDESRLRDTDYRNPVNQAGGTIWPQVSFPALTTREDAVEFGAAALAEFNTAPGPGTATKRGTILDREGRPQPTWKVRAGDRVVIADNPDDRVLVVQETNYSHASLSTQLSFAGPASRLDAVLDRVMNAQEAAGLR